MLINVLEEHKALRLLSLRGRLRSVHRKLQAKRLREELCDLWSPKCHGRLHKKSRVTQLQKVGPLFTIIYYLLKTSWFGELRSNIFYFSSRDWGNMIQLVKSIKLDHCLRSFSVSLFRRLLMWFAFRVRQPIFERLTGGIFLLTQRTSNFYQNPQIHFLC